MMQQTRPIFWNFRHHSLKNGFRNAQKQNRPGLCPGPRWRSLQRSPRPPSWRGRGTPLPQSPPRRLRRLASRRLDSLSRFHATRCWQPYVCRPLYIVPSHYVCSKMKYGWFALVRYAVNIKSNYVSYTIPRCAFTIFPLMQVRAHAADIHVELSRVTKYRRLQFYCR
jgi:hypothetical protein